MTSPLPPDDEQRLLRLLSLKRYETPPPGFFEHLPRRILVSVRAGVEVEDRSWWERLRDLVVREPMVAGSYAALGLGAVLFGVSVFETARGPGDDPPLVLQGALGDTPSFVNPTPASLPSGAIYRVVTTVPSREWLTVDGLPALRLERVDHRGEALPSAVFLSLPR